MNTPYDISTALNLILFSGHAIYSRWAFYFIFSPSCAAEVSFSGIKSLTGGDGVVLSDKQTEKSAQMIERKY